MKLLIDTNVILDYLVDRIPYAAHSEQIIDLCVQGSAEGFLTASSATDIYYIMRKAVGQAKAMENLKVMLGILNVAGVLRSDLLRAMELDMADFEDALAAICAKRIKAEYIVTRNGKDFTGSPVKPITPDRLLRDFF